ncbi:laccase domain protein [Azorhizobium oxalatiphilum]|uniref:Purine nucleoside phosphorylase n=1 Tax=Azorhizobium oxalatiphilum TaxID=980631 RepID=A0A917CJE4_9HYPH|nr:peptidoglycan editing factor PgeF [Azorhizobium oxalatiphilum]GGF88328.1 laccase domain protein [Azorhizobium oxalatiphilum]
MKVEASSLAALPGIRHAFFTRQGGVSSGIYDSLNGGLGSKDAVENVMENRARMARAIGVTPENLVMCSQVHSAICVPMEAPWTRANAPSADAIATRVPGLAATVTIADCGPVLFADPVARVVGAAHSGWKGAFGGVIEATVAQMENLGARRADIRAVIGPLIRQPSYEVGEDFISRFIEEDRTFTRFFAPADRPHHALFDLPGFIALRLRQARIDHVEDLGLDTYADPARFFSYRRSTHKSEPDYGRLVAAITLE